MKPLILVALLASCNPAFADDTNLTSQQQQTEESIHSDDAYNAGYDVGYDNGEPSGNQGSSYGQGVEDGNADAYQEYMAQRDEQ